MIPYINPNELPNWNNAHHGMFSRIPKDIASFIFSFLTLTEIRKITLVCTYWKKLLQPPRVLEMLKGAHFNQHSIIHSFSQGFSSLLVVNKTKAFAVYRNQGCAFFEFGQPNQSVQASLKYFEGYNEILDQTDNLVFLTERESDREFSKVSCIQKEDGKILFKFSRWDKIVNRLDPTRFQSVISMIQLVILQKDPLKFLIVQRSGSVVTFSFEDGQLKSDDFWLFSQENFDTSYYVKNNELLIQCNKKIGKIATYEFYLYNLIRQDKRKIDIKEASLLDEKLLIFKQYSEHKNTISRFEIVDQQINLKYRLSLEEGKLFVSGNLLIFINLNEIKFINAEDGKEMFSLYKPDHPFLGCHYFHIPYKARRYEGIFILVTDHDLLLVDLASGNNLYKEFKKPSAIVDCNLKGNTLYFLYNSDDACNFTTLELSGLKESQTLDTANKSFSKIYQVKQPSNLPKETIQQKPLESIPPASKNQTLPKSELERYNTSAISSSKPPAVSVKVYPASDLPKKSTRQKPLESTQTLRKITTIALSILTLLLASISVYFGIMHSINLSIGVGIISALTGVGAGYLAFKINQGNKL